MINNLSKPDLKHKNWNTIKCIIAGYEEICYNLTV